MMDGFSDNVPQLTLTTPNRLHIASILRGAVTAREGPSRLGVLLGLPPPLFSPYASCDWWRVQFLVVSFPPWVLSDSLSSLRPASFGLLACLNFGPCPLFLFLSLLFIKFGRVSSDYTFNEGDALDLFS